MIAGLFVLSTGCASTGAANTALETEHATSTAAAQPAKKELDCGAPIPGTDGLFQPGVVVMVGELHGTNEIPAAVGRMLCHAVKGDRPMRLVLELVSSEQGRVDAFIASAGTEEDKKALLAGDAWNAPFQAGLQSVAMLRLLDEARRLRQNGAHIEVALMGAVKYKDGQDRDNQMADALEAARAKAPEVPTLVLAGAGHIHKTKGAPWDSEYAWTARRLADHGLPVTSLAASFEKGFTWACMGMTSESCGVQPFAARHHGVEPPSEAPAVRLGALEKGMFDGMLFVGAISPALPAARPELVDKLPALIEAARSSPMATRMEAQEAYDRRDFGLCADLYVKAAKSESKANPYDVQSAACCLVLAGRMDEAVQQLIGPLKDGSLDLKGLEKDEDLAALRDSPRWADLVRAAQTKKSGGGAP